MDLKFKWSTSKITNFIDTDETFLEHLKFSEFDYYAYYGTLTVMDENHKTIADITVLFCDEDKAYNDGLSLFEIADDFDADAGSAMAILEDYKGFSRAYIDENKLLIPLSICYLQKFYIYPEYRGKGIGKYIWQNLCDILEYYGNTTIHCIVTYPSPQEVSINESVYNSSDNPEMLQKMIHCLKKSKYKEIKNTGFYVRNYASKY